MPAPPPFGLRPSAGKPRPSGKGQDEAWVCRGLPPGREKATACYHIFNKPFK